MGRGLHQASKDIIEAAYDILEEIRPATVRATCYQLFIRGLIPDMSKKSTNKVSGLLVRERENGNIPWEWIVDETRSVEQSATWDDPESIIKETISIYRKNYWKDQEVIVEVISEKGTVRGTLAPVLEEYAVPFTVMHGFGSATTVNDIAQRSANTDKPMVLLYVGDYDPSGLYMSEVDLPERLERYGARDRDPVKRIALTNDDVADDDLPYFEASEKSKDRRYDWFVTEYGDLCWELDAMNPVALRQRVKDAIRSYLDVDAWEHSRRIEATEHDSMRNLMAAWNDSISGQANE